MKTRGFQLLKHAEMTVELCKSCLVHINSELGLPKKMPVWIHKCQGLAFQSEDAFS